MFLDLPIDARPPSERQDGGYVYPVPVPILYYGDLNLRPGAVHAVDRTLHDAVRAAAVPISDDREDADLIVRTFVRSHHGSHDMSDAQWVSYATAGLAGIAGQFLYPAFMITEVELRLELLAPDGEVLAVRDVAHVAVRRRPAALTWGVWSLWQQAPLRDLFADAFAEVHLVVGTRAARIIDAARDGLPLDGAPPTTPGQHFLAETWDRPFFEPGTPDARVRAKYPNTRFSPLTGHDAARGEVIGKLAFPLDTVGYEVAVADRVQVLADLTVLLMPQVPPDQGGLVLPIVGGLFARGGLGRLYSSAAGGARAQVLHTGAFALSVEGRAGGRWLLSFQDGGLQPAGLLAQGGVIASWRPGGDAPVESPEITWFGRAGLSHAVTLDEAVDLPTGSRALFGPGATVQLTPTVAVGLEVPVSVPVDGSGPITFWPQLTLGLR